MGRIAGVSPEETRTRLIDAAARLFEQQGFEKATVSQIAKEAGVSSGAIYAHYSTKAELLADALRHHGHRATGALFPEGVRTDITKVLHVLASRLHDRDPAESALLSEALLAARRDDQVASVIAKALTERQDVMIGTLVRGQDEGVLDDGVSAPAAARFALMLGLGSILIGSIDLPPVDEHDWNQFIDHFLNAFTKESKS